ncbi:serine/threonine protein kinase [Candidatus Sumerlaeota bacterium]|nr:serine/threonine protein kinase [Candidatus Sumerlaeota bacterium]
MQDDTLPFQGKESTSIRALSLVGRILENRYSIEEIIGEGAMGYVYKGTQLRLKRTVAIKIPRQELALDPNYMSRFEREALSMARCVHENIVTIYDVYVGKNPDELSYIAMEFITGSNFHQFLRAEEANLTIRAVLEILKQLARGIDAAHAAGVVHRDIKPANMIVTQPQRIAKIMDFGIAKTEYDSAYKTQVGFSIGTPAFMAPEQIRGEPIGPPADIYSFAVSLYKIFARNLPFDVISSGELLSCHLNETPILLRKRNPAWPQELERTLAVSMSKNPEIRHATASQLVEEIDRSLQAFYNRPFAEFFINQELPLNVSSEKKRSPILKRLHAPVMIPLLILFSGFAFFWIMKSKENAPSSPDLTSGNAHAVSSPVSGSSASGKNAASAGEISPKDFRLEAKRIDDLMINGVRMPIFRGQLNEARTTMENIDLDKKDSFLRVIDYYGEEYKNLTLIYIPLERNIGKERALIRFRTGLTGIKRSSEAGAVRETLVPSFEATAFFVKKGREWKLTDWSSLETFWENNRKGE